MDDKLTKLIDVLSELRNSSQTATLETIKLTMDKYDMLFLGENFNSIYSIELAHSLKNVFKINISHDELLSLIPIACSILSMNFEELVVIGDPNNRCYSINLF